MISRVLEDVFTLFVILVWWQHISFRFAAKLKFCHFFVAEQLDLPFVWPAGPLTPQLLVVSGG